ncbi:MAG: decarboxylase [Cyanothece sp. SIO2G6]|nr:decarboxylase [Cyanothece sp. SIO2G6]
MKKLQPKLTPDYNNPELKQALSKLLAERLARKQQRPEIIIPSEPPTSDVTADVAAWFLGLRGENNELFKTWITAALDDHTAWRGSFYPDDPSPITPDMKTDPAYTAATQLIATELDNLFVELRKSAPFVSMRYQGHMIWDQTLPGMLGYFAAMLYNQNNVALEASPVTTVLEADACLDLCEMLGYDITSDPKPWGHLTCGGSTANIEALWAARNLKYYPLSFRKGLTAVNQAVADSFMVNLPSGTPKSLTTLSIWEILNLSVDEVLALFDRAVNEYSVSAEALNAAIDPCTLQNMGFMDFSAEFLTDSTVGDGVVLVPASKHYSLTKGTALLGLGANNMYSVPLDKHGRMDKEELTSAINGYTSGSYDGKKHPIIAVVAIFGTTEEGIVDSLTDVLAQQSTYRTQDVDFVIHADCAWGGYFAALLRDDGVEPVSIAVSQYVLDEFNALGSADTITIDPHKTGYLPYPAGALCYRNITMRSLIAFEAPYINTGDSEKPEWLLGNYGIEGSKPGAAAAGVHLSHAAIPLKLHGYGKLMTLTAYNCKVLHWKLVEAGDLETGFTVEPTPYWTHDPAQTKEESVKSFLNQLSGKSPKAIFSDPTGADLALLSEQGGDLNLLTYAFNLKNTDGSRLTDLNLVNEFNELIFEKVSVKANNDTIDQYRIMLSRTYFVKELYGEVFFQAYLNRLFGLSEDTPIDPAYDSIMVMRSTIMDPWLSEVEDSTGKPFIDQVVTELFNVVREAEQEFRTKYPDLFGG